MKIAAAEKSLRMMKARRVMDRLLQTAAALMMALASACHGDAEAAQTTVPVIPAPASVEFAKGEFALTRDASLYAEGGDEARRIAAYFAELMRRTAGFDLKPVGSPDAASPSGPVSRVLFTLDEKVGIPAGGYRVEISPQRAVVSAATPQGLFHGAVTLWQLATPAGEKGVRIRSMRIDDAPGLSWRGAMLDSARHYQPPDFIKSFIDWMALHKLNVFHWHLTDDQAWRLEIKKYPKLTEIGAYRTPAGEAAKGDIDQRTGAPRLYGGYYTQEEVQEIVAYARDRFITIVPEIDMPGHAQAAIVAYPELGAGGARPTAVSSHWGVFPYIYNVDDATFDFLEDVLEETAALFPGAYIHVGGDEAVKDHWRTDEHAQERMRALGLRDETALQGYFTHRMGAVVDGLGRRLVGWDEILDGGLSEDAVVMSWRGAEGAVEAARQGRDAILSPAPALYFDNRQGAGANEPPGRGGVVTLESVYRFEPYPKELKPAERPHVIGAQANIWTEHIRTTERVERMAYPRLAALAEVAWAPEAEREWPGFVRRLVPMLARYQSLGIDYAKSAFEPRISITEEEEGDMRVRIDNQAGSGEVRYTLDGSPPHASSPRYKEDIVVRPPATMTATTFIDGTPIASASVDLDGRNHLTRTSQELQTCEEKLVLNLEDDAPLEGPRPVYLIDIMAPCWIFPKAALTGVSEIEVRVGQIPFNFEIGDDIEKIKLRPPQTPEGELEARLDGCDGDVIAKLPLAPAAGDSGVTALRQEIRSISGAHDLCFTFTGDGVDPMWAIDRVRLIAAEAPAP